MFVTARPRARQERARGGGAGPRPPRLARQPDRQRILHQRQDGGRAGADEGNIVRLLRAERRLAQQVQRADDDRGGRADLVAHAGSEHVAVVRHPPLVQRHGQRLRLQSVRRRAARRQVHGLRGYLLAGGDEVQARRQVHGRGQRGERGEREEGDQRRGGQGEERRDGAPLPGERQQHAQQRGAAGPGERCETAQLSKVPRRLCGGRRRRQRTGLLLVWLLLHCCPPLCLFARKGRHLIQEYVSLCKASHSRTSTSAHLYNSAQPVDGIDAALQGCGDAALLIRRCQRQNAREYRSVNELNA